jgi:hypothetical protein
MAVFGARESPAREAGVVPLGWALELAELVVPGQQISALQPLKLLQSPVWKA